MNAIQGENYPLLKCNKTGKIFKVDHTPFSIGRSREADIICKSVAVSRNHCKLELDSTGQCKVMRTGSSGTFINNKLLEANKHHLLSDNDVLQVGNLDDYCLWTYKCNKPIASESEKTESHKLELHSALEATHELLQRTVTKSNHEKELLEKQLQEQQRKLKELAEEKHTIELIFTEEQKKKSEAEEKVKELATVVEQQACDSAVRVNQVEELLEAELQCGVCTELFVTAVTLNCSHTFCQLCLKKWRHKVCPLCRTNITSENRALVIDNYIEKMVSNLSEEFRAHRAALVADRQREEEESLRRSPVGRGRSGRRGRGRGGGITVEERLMSGFLALPHAAIPVDRMFMPSYLDPARPPSPVLGNFRMRMASIAGQRVVTPQLPPYPEQSGSRSPVLGSRLFMQEDSFRPMLRRGRSRGRGRGAGAFRYDSDDVEWVALQEDIINRSASPVIPTNLDPDTITIQ